MTLGNTVQQGQAAQERLESIAQPQQQSPSASLSADLQPELMQELRSGILSEIHAGQVNSALPVHRIRTGKDTKVTAVVTAIAPAPSWSAS